MISLRRAAPLALLMTACALATQVSAAPSPPPPALPDARTARLGGDERAAKLSDRYRAMLTANPGEGLALDRLWKVYEEHGASAELLEDYRRESQATNSAASLLIYGHLLKRAGRLDEAADAYGRAALVDPANPLPPLAEADLAASRSRPADAAASFDRALEKMPRADSRRGETLLKAGDAWLLAGDPAKAAARWEETISLDPGNVALRQRLAGNYEKNGLPDRAIAQYEYIEAHSAPSKRVAALRELARIHESRGEFDPARDALERGIGLVARDNWLYGELQSSLIRLYERAGKVPELEARWTAAVDRAPRDLGGYLRLETLSEAQGDVDGEKRWLEKIVALAPGDRDNALKLARLLVDAGERERAAALYDQVLKLQPENLDLILARADLDLQMGRAADAAARIDARLDASPGDETLVAPALQFFLTHHLDESADRLLRAGVARQPAATEPAIALAKFEFSRRRSNEGRAALERLASQPGDPTAKAARLMAVADAYKEEGLADDALLCWQRAATLVPSSPAPLTASAEVLMGRGDSAAASAILRKAVDLMPDGPERLEVERKLFQILSDASGSPRNVSGIVSTARPRLSIPFVLAPGATGVAIPLPTPMASGAADSPLESYIGDLEKRARVEETAADDLRLARWQEWAHRLPAAEASARKAIALDPGNISARELLVATAVEERRLPFAETTLREIIRLDPSRKNASLRQIASFKLEGGQFDEAISILDGLVRDSPGSIAELTDLALAQQRADRWYDALATWERAYALPSATPAQRADLRRPMLAAEEHLDRYPRAAELMGAAVDAESDLGTKQDLFRELLTFCQKHELAGSLRAEYEKRAAAQPQDYFTLVALSELRKAEGRESEAYRLLEQAYYSAPDPVATLHALVAEAESLGEIDQAVAHQRHLVSMSGQGTADNLEKLSELQEFNLDEEGATRTWEQIAAKFPRDTVALGNAADFFEKMGRVGRTRELLAQIVATDEGDLARTFYLGKLDLESGDAEGARKLFEQILARTEPEKPGDPLIVPEELQLKDDPAAPGSSMRRLARRGKPGPGAAFVSRASAGDATMRLGAIRELARGWFPTPGSGVASTALTPGQKAWLERWSAAASTGLRNEPLAAFYFAGQDVRVMDDLERWIGENPPDRDLVRDTFLAAGLRTGQYGRLAKWAWAAATGDDPERPEELADGLGRFLASGGHPGSRLVAELFPAGVKEKELLWQVAAGTFAEKRWYAQAAELGERAFALSDNGGTGYAFEIAQWELDAGRPEGARAILAAAIEERGGYTLEAANSNALYADLRAYYLMLPPLMRRPFAEDYLRRRALAKDRVDTVLCGVVLHGLLGDGGAARRDVDSLVALRMMDGESGAESPDARRWSYLLTNGTQLQAWGLNALAAYLWRRALDEPAPFDRGDAEARGTIANIRSRLLATEVLLAHNPEVARVRVAEYLSGDLVGGMASVTAANLLATAQFPAAERLYEFLCESNPSEGELWQNLLAAYEGAGDTAKLECTLNRLLEEIQPLPPGINRFEIINRLAQVRENGGDSAGAIRLLAGARMEFPRALSPVMLLAQAQERAGLLDDAERSWREAIALDATSSARTMLATLEERRGRFDDAIALLEAFNILAGETGPDAVDPRLVRLYLKAGRATEARSLAFGRLKDGQLGGIVEIAEVYADAGQSAVAIELLGDAVRRARDPRQRLHLQEALVGQYARKHESVPAFVREMQRLRIFARAENPGAPDALTAFEYETARKAGADAWLEGELRREWKDGGGDIVAGVRLASLYINGKNEERLREVIAAIDRRPALPADLLYALWSELVAARQPALSLPIAERLHARYPQNESYVLAHARALWECGRRVEANAMLAVLDRCSIFRDDPGAAIAALYRTLGDDADATRYYEYVVHRDPDGAHSSNASMELARCYLKDQRFADAARVLRRAYGNPACGELQPLVDYLDLGGFLNGDLTHHMPGSGFPLTAARRSALLNDLYERLKSTGRPEAAAGLVRSNPALLGGIPSLVQRLGKEAGEKELPALADLFEQALSQSMPPTAPALERALSGVYARLARVELESGAGKADAISHLERAHDLVRDDFAVASQLATLYMQQKQNGRAAGALKDFLGPRALPTERAEASQILGKR